MPLLSSSNNNTNNSNYEYTTTNIPAFLSKLWTLVEDAKYDKLIAWDESGFSFHVYDQTRFSKEILPRFFKHNNMASFIRQLNMYGFRKVNSIDHGSLKNEKEDLEFHHPYFIKGKEQFLEFIKRKVPDIKSAPATPAQAAAINTTSTALAQTTDNPTVQYTGIKEEELNKVLDDVNFIKSKQKYVDDSLMNVKKENEILWKEIATLRQKHHHQQQIVNKLIHFLVHLVNPTSLAMKRMRPLMIDSHAASNLSSADFSDDEAAAAINEIEEEDEDFLTTHSMLSLRNKRLRHLLAGSDYKEFSKQRQEALVNTSKKLNAIAAINSLNDEDIELQPPSKKQRANGNSFLQYLQTNNMEDRYERKQLKDDQPIVSNLSSSSLNQLETMGSKSAPNANINRQQSLNGMIGNQYLANSPNNLSAQTGGVVINEIVDSPNANLIQFDANNTNVKDSRDFIDTSLFLNTPMSGQDTNDPVVTAPASPLDHQESNGLKASGGVTYGAKKVPTINIANNSNNNTNSQINQVFVSPMSNPTNGNEANANVNNAQVNGSLSSVQTTDPDLKRSLSNSMCDHVESLQLDLNSIKDFLTSTSFNNTIDQYTINNLFSPIDLDPVENETFYLEAPTSNVVETPSIETIDKSKITQQATTLPTSIQESTNNNGKLIGQNETNLVNLESNDLLSSTQPSNSSSTNLSVLPFQSSFADRLLKQ